MSTLKPTDVKISLISLHGLIRGTNPELGRDADTGGQIKYVLELARELGRHEKVASVELLTRQIFDDRVDPIYAQSEEQIGPNVKIVRIPFGPKRYLRKESLWPYLEMFIDQALFHYKQTGLPDIIHGHYADAGRAGASLSRLLHIPFVFTGHSLGRVKRERLLANASSPEAIEKRYNLTTRIEAEEFALESAAMVVTSTHQEVEEQYEMYDQYVPERMEVIPPGVDLDSFSPEGSPQDGMEIIQDLTRFLVDPTKPAIFAMARPDERKNLARLVKVFGESSRLQELANLVVVMGSRDDVKDLPSGQRKVIEHVIQLVDRYDLYGHIAYPKSHLPGDVPGLYRHVKNLGGVFVNAALTEPFGLTLLEAAATGIPVVATNDGGPRDILANCHNGVLVDPLNEDELEQKLFDALSDTQQWQQWSDNGLAGAKEFYNWSTHAERYLKDLNKILSSHPPSTLHRVSARPTLPEFDRLIITDLDNTLTGDDDSLRELIQLISENPHVGFGIATGRPLDSAVSLIKELGLPDPDLLDVAVGTELYYGEKLILDRRWQGQIGYQWKPDEIRQVLDNLPGFYLQSEENQSTYKISYEIDREKAPSLSQIKKSLRQAGIKANVVLSLDMYLDVIPVRGGSEYSLRHLLYRWGFSSEKVLVGGDCGNDEGMLKGGTLGVVVGNHSSELEKLRNWPRIYFAEGCHARGLIEGINYYQFLDDIIIPNDNIEEQVLVET